MDTRIIVAAVVVPLGVLLILVVVILRWRSSSSKGGQEDEEFAAETARIRSSQGLQSGIAKVQLSYKKSASLRNSYHHHHHDFHNKKLNFYVLGRELSSTKPFFSWADHPLLVSDAVEYGWPRFGFAGQNMSTMTGSVLLGLCVSSDQVRESRAEISWEICSGSAEFMQKVKLNSGSKTPPSPFPFGGASCATQTALPLPGPFLGNSSFPQEAYFEISILTTSLDDADAGGRNVKDRKTQGEKTKLIQQVVDVNEEATSTEAALVPISLGLSVGASHPHRLPGTYLGSIGFNSNGSIYLDGIKLVVKSNWGNTTDRDRVIGCGFDPSQKKVFFTLDSELVHVIQCKSEEFGRPLYPTLAANIDATVIVNLGQSSFKYAPANIHRTPDPCFIGCTAALGYEDSKELFSMGRIDSGWLNRKSTQSHSTVNKAEFDEESETDLFEIVLDNSKRSPNTYL